MGAKKWIVILSFIAVSILAMGYFASGLKMDILKGMSTTSPLFWAVLTLLAAADSINPCMISVMILMIATLAALGLEKRSVLMRALVFTITIFITYFLLGVLLFYGYSYLSALSIAIGGFNILKLILVIILIIGGIINIKDAIKGGKASFSIPESAKPTIQALMTYVSIVAAFLLGVFVTFVELPCTGIFYIGLIAYLHSISHNLLSFIPILVYYNIIFVGPEVIITLFVWKGMDPTILKEWYEKHRKGMRFLEGAVMILLGILVYLFVRVG